MSPTSAALPAAVLAGVVAVLVTRSIERLGGRLGGVLGTMPSTIVPASLGLYASTGSAEAFVASMAITPAGMLANALFLWLWRVLPPYLPRWDLLPRLVLMITLSLVLWSLGAAAAVLGLGWVRAAAPGDSRPLFGLGVLLTALSLMAGLIACMRNPPSPRGHRPVPLAVLISRGLLAAAAIGASVALAQVGGPLVAGVASVFPAIFLTTMLSLWLSQGEAVQAGAVGPMMLGSTAVSAYALLSALLMPALGPALGATLSWVLAVLGLSGPAAWLLTRRQA